MNFKVVGSLIAAVAALVAQGAFSQTTPPASRADVKAETAAAGKKGELNKPGEGMPQEKASGKSTKTRDDRKAETAAAGKKGELSKPGEGMPQDKAAAKSTKSRAEVKAETADAAKKGQLPVAGEAPAKK